ncbi:MAG: PKD domain-containing protein, partial [Desulfobacterales bacterium]|nr:PKD domain-containing protein [Desulfobacterales bacterium]
DSAPTSPNQPPQADAGPDLTVNVGDLVTLDGSNSSDPDDGIAGYLWKQVDGPQVKLNNPPPERPTFIAPQVSEGKAALTFELTVTDSAGQPATDTAVVTVLAVGDPTEPEQPSLDGVLARIRTLLGDPDIPEEVRQRLERVKNQLERASAYWQNDRSERALRIVTRCAKNLRIAAKMTRGVPQLQEELSAIIVDLKNIVRAPAEAPAPVREDDSDENSSIDGDDDEEDGKDSDDHEDDEDDERSERNAGNAWRSYLSGFFRR